MLYLVMTTDEIPVGVSYRVLGSDLTYWDGNSLVETIEPCEGLIAAPTLFPNGIPTDPNYDPEFQCTIPWQVNE
jgi:hypothetical protein